MPPDPPITDTSILIEKWGATIAPDLLALALIHRSWANEAGGVPNNERLEFLGDSVLSIVTAERLYIDHPETPESDLSRMRAASVAQDPLAEAARRIDLGSFIYLGRGESRSGGSDKPSILSDTFEALVGATYLTHGFSETRRVVLTHLGFLLERASQAGAAIDWKTAVVEEAARRGLGIVSYVVTSTGPDHARTFTADLHVSTLPEVVATGEGTSRKAAEFAAARTAVARMMESSGL
ncbi:MAG: ribonuclease III [Actinomycetaceae bacterium]|nr:ribonuclease III [Actinomycetaceae bacterium]